MRRGFTLIELLVVISIIALLIAILLPALQKTRDTAMQVQCLSRMRQVGIGARTFAIDNDQILPPIGIDSDPHKSEPWQHYDLRDLGEVDGSHWVNMGRFFNEGYIEDPTAFYCPALDEPELLQEERYLDDEGYFADTGTYLRAGMYFSPQPVKPHGNLVTYERNLEARHSGMAMASDFLPDPPGVGFDGPKDLPGPLPHDSTFNMVFTDGSGSGLRSPAAMDIWKKSTSIRPTKDWTVTRNIIREFKKNGPYPPLPRHGDSE